MRRFVLFLCVCLLGGCNVDEFVIGMHTAQCAADRQPPDSVIAACTPLIDAPSTRPEMRAFALITRSGARTRTGDLDGALSDANRLVDLTPADGRAYAWRGTTHGTRGDLDAAIRDFEKAAELDPQDAKHHYANLGTAYDKKGQFDRALKHYDQAIALDPDFQYAIGGRCWVRGVLGSDLDGALADCNRALQANPDEYNIYNSRGFVQFRREDYAAAIADYDRAIAGNPDIGSSYYVRGLAKRALGQTGDGDADIARGTQIEPGVAQRYAKYGVAAPRSASAR